ncbi:MAG: hypothetical protein JRN52_06530 [Nitrososphaerota archaeon]|nr:hypothetical protein [Nitrososphaerota archaeon]
MAPSTDLSFGDPVRSVELNTTSSYLPLPSFLSILIGWTSGCVRWKKTGAEFTGVGSSENRGFACTIPRSVVEALGGQKRINFMIKGGKVEIESAEDSR